jgi:hypothetical protein
MPLLAIGLTGHPGLAAWTAAPWRIAAVRGGAEKPGPTMGDRLPKNATHTFDPLRTFNLITKLSPLLTQMLTLKIFMAH